MFCERVGVFFVQTDWPVFLKRLEVAVKNERKFVFITFRLHEVKVILIDRLP